MRLIIDSHLDLSWNALSWRRELRVPLDELNRRENHLTDEMARGRATVSLPEMRRGGVGVALGTLIARVPEPPGGPLTSCALDYPAAVNAYAAARGQLAYYRILQELGEIHLIEKRRHLESHWRRWLGGKAPEKLPVGIIVAMEGSDAIVDPGQVATWFEFGLRCAGLVHYGCNKYAVGTGEDGPLTSQGHELLKVFGECGVILDVTHLSDTSFFEASEVYDGPLLASHQNCRALVPGARQFSDEQVRLVIERGGILGVAADAWMLHPEWKRGATTSSTTRREVVGIEAMADHIDHICQLAGNRDHAAIGSDLDGGYGTEQTPMGLESIADLQKLDAILEKRGYDETDRDAVFHGNWLNFFLKQLPE